MLGADLAASLLAGDRAAVSEALNLIDDRRPDPRHQAITMLAELEARAPAGGALRIGVTGAPGAGKSTLLDACVHRIREAGETVGIIAVDPSSQRSGGALLGDRFRMRASARDRGVFVRSMAARDRLGGLADATHAGIEVMAAVFDWVFVETVGVGQSESDVAHQVDTLVFVAQPGAGDMLQFMKAGLLELPDVFVVNKADLGAEATRTASELGSGLGLGEQKNAGWEPPVILTAARDGDGVDELLDALRAHRRQLEKSDALVELRRRCRCAFVEEALARRYGSFGLERLGGREGVRKRVAASPRSVFAQLIALGEEIEAGDSGPRSSKA
jgi:LAO/AO transport system kinase